MAIIQIIILSLMINKDDLLIIINMPYWFIGPIVFFLVDKYIFLKIDDQKYIHYSNTFLFIIKVDLILIKYD